MKNHQKFKKSLKRVCLCLVTGVVAVGVSSNCIWAISPLHWKGAHHSPRDAKHKGKFKQTPMSGSINHELLTTSGSYSPLPPSCTALKGIFYQLHSARTTISMKAPCVALAHCQTRLDFISFHHQSPRTWLLIMASLTGHCTVWRWNFTFPSRTPQVGHGICFIFV